MVKEAINEEEYPVEEVITLEVKPVPLPGELVFCDRAATDGTHTHSLHTHTAYTHTHSLLTNPALCLSAVQPVP